jgi:hypothetical protein
LAEKNGFKRICEAHYLGLENFAAELDPEVGEALMRAIRKAVVNINADKKRYLHYLIEEMPEKYRSDPEPYSREDFEPRAEWMKKWDLVPKDASYEELVKNAFVSSTPEGAVA